jgi:hypothetical protein
MKHRKKKDIRQEWRAAVFNASGGSCVVCTAKAVDAHHVYPRDELPHQGYTDRRNGVALCAECHKEAEAGKINAFELKLCQIEAEAREDRRRTAAVLLGVRTR